MAHAHLSVMLADFRRHGTENFLADFLSGRKAMFLEKKRTFRKRRERERERATNRERHTVEVRSAGGSSSFSYLEGRPYVPPYCSFSWLITTQS